MHRQLISGFLVLFASLPAAGQEADLAMYMDAQAASTWFMGTVLVRRGDDVLLHEAYGSADLEHDVALGVHSKFLIGSITKSYAGALLCLSHDQGELDLEDLLSDHLADLPATWSEIRLRHLLHHRSGIPDIEELADFASDWKRNPTRPLATMQCFTDEPLQFEPDARFAYSSSGYVLIAAVLEKVTGRTWEELLQERLFKPLSLTDTGHAANAPVIRGRASGYTAAGPGLVNAGYVAMSVPIGGGDMYASASDLDRWVRMLWRGELLSGDAHDWLFTPAAITHASGIAMAREAGGLDVSGGGGYAAGWFIGRRGEHALVQHGGAIDGFVAYLAYYPESELSVAVLSNVDLFNLTLEIGVDLGGIVLGEEVSLPVVREEIELDEELLVSFAGDYQFGASMTIRMTLEAGRLTLNVPGRPGRALFPMSETDFFTKVSDDQTFSFQHAADGSVSGVSVARAGRSQQGKRL